jgi:pyruvate/2-oxoglutarate dehydrogenase complex dihydrolipoamide dehydrogenase (E3) component
MTRVGRAVEKGETQGFMKVLVDADNKEILGAAILGTGGDEVVHGILDVMYAKAPTPCCSERCRSIRPFQNYFRPYSAISNPCERKCCDDEPSR